MVKFEIITLNKNIDTKTNNDNQHQEDGNRDSNESNVDDGMMKYHHHDNAG
jgi:hypothetical protein